MESKALESHLIETRAKLLGSLLLFIQTFFPLITGREFKIHEAVGRESHIITICRELTYFFYLKTRFLSLNIAPGHFKTTLVVYFMAWSYAHHGDCNFLYISGGYDLAATQTALLKAILQLPEYRLLFNLTVDKDCQAKDNFKTTMGGAVKAYGATGSIVGNNAGYPYSDRFTGCVLCDDLHKPIEVESDVTREAVIENYQVTIRQRVRGENVGILVIGQRLHEEDVFSYFASEKSQDKWKIVSLPELDENENPLCPAVISYEELLQLRKYNPYVFYSQYQQTPQPAGGSIFKDEWWVLTEEEPSPFLNVFVTVDTAETDKTHNDATVFSLWGVYQLLMYGKMTPLRALHWIDCEELRVEPYQLEERFEAFYRKSLFRGYMIDFVAIEDKSTGVTLSSILEKVRGLYVRKIKRTVASGCKIQRFREIQPFVARRLVSINRENEHTQKVISHMSKLTGNGAHKHDDIADTLVDAVQLGLMSNTFTEVSDKKTELSSKLKENLNRLNHVRGYR